jgi:hypothetical protein
MRALRARQKLDAAITEADAQRDTDAGLRLRRERIRVTAARLPEPAARAALVALGSTPNRAEELDRLCATLDEQRGDVR